MNRLIARLFASLISLAHIIIIGTLGLISFCVATGTTDRLSPYINITNMPKDLYIPMIISLWIAYILFVGLLSTIIAINDNLNRLCSIMTHPQ